jgi:hypothetical protein
MSTVQFSTIQRYFQPRADRMPAKYCAFIFGFEQAKSTMSTPCEFLQFHQQTRFSSGISRRSQVISEEAHAFLVAKRKLEPRTWKSIRVQLEREVTVTQNHKALSRYNLRLPIGLFVMKKLKT